MFVWLFFLSFVWGQYSWTVQSGKGQDGLHALLKTGRI